MMVALRLFTVLAALSLTACAEMRETPSQRERYQAYGENWTYYSVERYTKSWGINTPHGIMGWEEELEQFAYLVTEEGESIPVHKRLYALQRDGSYKKVECCTRSTIQLSVRNFDKKLVAYFKQTRENTTDCFVHPEDHPDAEKEPDPRKRYVYVQLFGEFDPKAKVFRVQEFLPGFSRQEFREKVGARGSREQTEAFFYANRKPFICENRS